MTLLVLFALTLTTCLVSSVFPLVHTELYLVSVAAASSDRLAVPLILIATAAEMTGKSVVYLVGRGVVRLPTRFGKKIAEAELRFKDRGLGGLVLFLSAAIGLPPFYLVSIASGIFRVPFPRFVLFGLCGRLVRFSVVVLSPQAVKGFWPVG